MEQWIEWISQNDTSLPSYIKSILSDDDGLTIISLDREKKNKVIIKFNGALYTYRYTAERCFLKTLDYLSKNYQSSFIHGTTLFKVKNSQYLDWFKKESYDVWNSEEFKHYVVYTQEDVIEVLSPYPPEIEVKNIVKASE